MRRLRELEKLEREAEKQSELESSRLAVERHETRLAVLQSLHRESMEVVDWAGLAAQLPAPAPLRVRKAELSAWSLIAGGKLHGARAEEALLTARAVDETAWAEAKNEWEKGERERAAFASLAREVLRGERAAFERALARLEAFAEISEAGTSVVATIRDRARVECGIVTRGMDVLPETTKSLTVGGKLSEKPTPRARLHELFQDHIYSCVLRVAREVFACLPVEEVTVHASTTLFDPATGREGPRTVLSVRFDRARFCRLNFDRLDPSDAVEGFESRCDFKSSRKSGAFVAVEPLPPRVSSGVVAAGAGSLRGELERVRRLRAELALAAGVSGKVAP